MGEIDAPSSSGGGGGAALSSFGEGGGEVKPPARGGTDVTDTSPPRVFHDDACVRLA